MSNENRIYHDIVIPDRKKVGTPYEGDSRRDFPCKKGYDLACLTLPDGVNVTDIDGNEKDVSRFTFLSRPEFIKHDEGAGTYTVNVPEKNSSGADWEVLLSRSIGRYENGSFNVEETFEVRVTSTALKAAMDAIAE